MEKSISKITSRIYEIIFREKISFGIQNFIQNLGYAVFGYGIAALCMFGFQITVGRFLGPEEYGKYVLVDSIAICLQISMILGISTAMVKYGAERNDYETQKKIISTSYLIVCFFSLIFTLFFNIFSNRISRFFFVSSLIFRFSIIFALLYTVYILSTDVLRSLHKIKKLAIYRAGFGLLIIVALGIFMLNKSISFLAAVSSICFAYFLIFILITLDIRKYLSFHLDKFWAYKFFRYGIFTVVSTICFVFLPIFSKLLVNKYLSTFDVGIYNAYYFSSVGIIIFLSETFITVFFPTVSKYQNKESILRKIRQLMPYLIVGGIFIIFTIEWIFLNLYGAKYPINYFLMWLFSFSSIFIAIYSIYSWLFLSEGMRGIKLVTFSAIITASINIFISFYFIPIFALYGAIVSLGIAYFIGIACLFLLKKKILLA